MNWNIPFTTDRTHSQTKIGLIMAAIGLLALVAVAVIPGGVAAIEVTNDTVEVTNETGEIYVETEFASGIDDANANADVVITDANGSEVANTSISGNASETIVEEWTINDSDPTGNYTVVVDADSGIVSTADVGTFSETSGGGGGAGAADGWGTYQGYPVWMIAVGAIAAALIGHSREWWDLSEVAP